MVLKEEQLTVRSCFFLCEIGRERTQGDLSLGWSGISGSAVFLSAATHSSAWVHRLLVIILFISVNLSKLFFVFFCFLFCFFPPSLFCYFACFNALLEVLYASVHL